MKLIFLILVFQLLAFNSQAQVISIDRPEIEAQRRQYEEHLYNRVYRVLSTILEPDSFVINVGVQLKTLAVENVQSLDPVEETPSGLEISKAFNQEEGVLPLSKLGVWKAPRTQKERELGYARRLRNFSELIQSINVDVVVDQDRIPASKRQTARQVLQRFLSGSLPVVARLRLEALPIATADRAKEQLKEEIISKIDEKVEKLRKEQNDVMAKREIASTEKVKEKTLIEIATDFKEVIATLLTSLPLGFWPQEPIEEFRRRESKWRRLSLLEVPVVIPIQRVTPR